MRRVRRCLPAFWLAGLQTCFYHCLMPSAVDKARKWRRFNRKYGTLIFVSCVVGGIVLLVGLLMWMLSSPEFRARW